MAETENQHYSEAGPRRQVQKTVMSATSALANLLPTGTVLAFQALAPSFSNGGSCHSNGGGLTNTLLTSALVAVCSVACFLSSFTDSFVSPNDGKLLYGIATFKGLYVFNANNNDDDVHNCTVELSKYRIRPIDFVHAVAALAVFLVVSIGDHDVRSCFFAADSRGLIGEINYQLMVNLPVGVGVFATLLFVIFPTTRKGIGYADVSAASSQDASIFS